MELGSAKVQKRLKNSLEEGSFLRSQGVHPLAGQKQISRYKNKLFQKVCGYPAFVAIH